MTTPAPTGTGTDLSTPPPTPPATPPAPATPPPDPAATETVDHWKGIARLQEQRAKENAQKAKDYDALVAATATEAEKAAAKARDEGRAEGIKTGATKVAQAEIRAAAAGRPVDADALLEMIDASKFIDADGEVDRAAIVAALDKVAPKGDGSPPPLDLGQGARGGQQNTGDPAQVFAKFIGEQLKG